MRNWSFTYTVRPITLLVEVLYPQNLIGLRVISVTLKGAKKIAALSSPR